MKFILNLLLFALRLLTRRSKPSCDTPAPIPVSIKISIPEEVVRPEWDAFCTELGRLESDNRYTIVNSYGYLGRYQFGLARLTDFGICHRKPGVKGFKNSSFFWAEGFSQQQFLRNKELQDVLFEAHIARHRAVILKKYHSKVGTKIRSVEITMAGMLACFHLVGEGGFRKLLRGGYSSDAYGTNALTYLRIFQKHRVPDDLKDTNVYKLRRDSRFSGSETSFS